MTRAVKRITPLVKALHLHKPRIAFIRSEDTVAFYINGTMDYPVIVIGVNHFEVSSDVCGCTDEDLETQMCITLAHEVCHAYLETLGMWCGDYEHPEELIEELSRDWYDDYITSVEVAKALDKCANKAGL